MDHYLHHLHADIRQRTVQLQSELIPIAKADPIGDIFAQVEAYLHGPEHDFAYWTDLSQDELPVPERLTDAQCAALVEALTELCGALLIQVEFPGGVPPRIKYQAMRNNWSESCSVGVGRTHWDFCSGDASSCDLGEYCTCKEFWEDDLPP